MTICVSVKVAEGLVMAADSAATLEGVVHTAQGSQPGIIQTFAYASKVAQIKDYPVGVMSWGAAGINDRSIQSLLMEFEYSYPQLADNPTYSVREIADKLLAFIRDRYVHAFSSKGTHPSLGLFIGGYSSKQFFAEAYTFEFPNSSDWTVVRPDRTDGRPSFGTDWYGQTGPLTRLINGFDLAALSQLVQRGADQNIVQQWVNDHVSEWPLIFDGMPIQDAIDFAEFAAEVTIGMFRFGFGPPICGGDIDIAVLTPQSFQWAKRKQWTGKQ